VLKYLADLAKVVNKDYGNFWQKRRKMIQN
jgi:hypothetical protein